MADLKITLALACGMDSLTSGSHNMLRVPGAFLFGGGGVGGGGELNEGEELVSRSRKHKHSMYKNAL